MRTAPFGELLGRLVGLSGLDIDEILTDQSASHRRFGEIALSMGLCTPEHIWQVWCDQLINRTQHIDLDAIGVDSQAATLIDRATAQHLGALPIRCLGDNVIIATTCKATDHLAAELALTSYNNVRFVQVDSAHLQRAIDRYLPGEWHRAG